VITDEQVAAFSKAHHWALIELEQAGERDPDVRWKEATRAGLQAALSKETV